MDEGMIEDVLVLKMDFWKWKGHDGWEEREWGYWVWDDWMA